MHLLLLTFSSGILCFMSCPSSSCVLLLTSFSSFLFLLSLVSCLLTSASSLLLHLLYFDPHPHPSPLIPHLSPLTSHPSPLTPHLSPLTSHLSPLTPHPSPLTPHLSPLAPCPSPLTPHPLPLASHLSPLTPHPSPLTPHLSPVLTLPRLALCLLLLTSCLPRSTSCPSSPAFHFFT